MAGAPSSVRKQIISVGKWVGLVAPGGGAKVEKGRSVFPSGRLGTAVTVRRGCRAKMGKRTARWHTGTKSAETVQHGCQPVWPSGKGVEAGKQRDLGLNPLRLSFLFEKVVFCGNCLVTLFLTINETLKWLSALPTLMQESLLVVTV